ncbi:MAG: hypothetical protein KDJ37_03030 [Hyphomicrobiaceae bacterium]|nr:hypothetical protein [Hyphomicrobiaceae bacterium]
MFKRVTMAAIAAAFAIVSMPAASEAGHHQRSARPACELTKMLNRVVHRTERAMHRIVRPVAVRPVHVRPARVHVRRDRPDWLRAMFSHRRR